jgi:hypothetical protein
MAQAEETRKNENMRSRGGSGFLQRTLAPCPPFRSATFPVLMAELKAEFGATK